MFAMVSGDMHPLHTNQAYAEKTSFGGRIAHGPFGVALAMGLFCRIPEFIETAIALTDIRNWSFRVPVYLGDTLDLEMKIAGKRITRSGKGVVDRDMRLVKSDGTVAQEGTMGLLIAMRD
jgi:acyl dehydratase